MAVSRILAGLAVAGAGAATVLAVGALPAIGSAGGTVTVTPAPAGQRLVCPGSVVAVGATGSSAGSLTSSGGSARTSGTAGGGRVTTVKLRSSGISGSSKTAPRLLTAAPQRSAGAIAGAQLQTVASGDAQGLAAAACTVPQAASWLAAGATTTGRTAVLLVTNPSTVGAQVTVAAWTEQGRVQTSGTGRVAVPARSRVALPVSSVAPNAAGTVLEVTSTGGQVTAALEQRTVRGLESGGIDVVGPTAAPSTSAVVPGVRVRNAAAIAGAAAQDDYSDLLPVVRVLVPGGSGGSVTVKAVSSVGASAVTLRRSVAAGAVTDLPLSGLTDGTWTVRVDADVPVVAGVRVSTMEAGAASTSGTGAAVDSGALDGGSATTADTSGRDIDLAWFAAATPLGDAAAVAVGSGADAQLALDNPTDAAVTVRAAGAATGTVRLPAGASTTLPARTGVVRLSGTDGIVAAVGYAGQGALGGYPAAAADQGAHAVRVSH